VLVGFIVGGGVDVDAGRAVVVCRLGEGSGRRCFLRGGCKFGCCLCWVGFGFPGVCLGLC
jgi:hypothetical protein